jgi:hypothetical protein
MIAVIAGVCGNQSGGSAAGTPKAVQLDGVDESLTVDSLFAGLVTADKVGAFSWGISANLPSVATGALIGDTSTGALNCTASIDIVSGTIRAYVQHSASTLVRRRTNADLVADTTFAVAVTRGAGTYPEVYLDGAVAGVNNGSTGATPNDSTSVAIGKNGSSHRAGYVWAFWWTPVEMSGAQVAALYALIDALDYAGAESYLNAISTSSVFAPVLSTDDLTSGSGSVEDVFGNATITPVGTEPSDLVGVPS